MPSLVKELMFKEVKEQFEKNPYVFISTFDGLTVADISEYRRSLEKVAKRSLVVKHSFAKKIFDDKKWSDANKFLKGQALVTFGEAEPQLISKTLVAYSKTNAKLVPAGVIFEDKVYDQTFVKQLAVMPSRHELLTQVVVRVKSPISGFVMTLGQMVRGLVVALNEVKKLKEAQPQTA